MKNVEIYSSSAADVYDAIYAYKDYEAEAEKLIAYIEQYKQTEGNDLLDVACGTGLSLLYLTDKFTLAGVDLSEQQLASARSRLPRVPFFQGDMREFNLQHQFDVVTCLYSSIGYVFPFIEMEKAVINMSDHVKPGGILLVEPWQLPKNFDPKNGPNVEAGELKDRGLKVVRTTTVEQIGNISVAQMHHVVERPEGVEEFTEEHKLAIYTADEFQSAFDAANLALNYEPEGLTGRGIYIGVKSA